MSGDNAACSGLMYSGVPTSMPCSVTVVWVAGDVWIALAIPKSMIFGVPRPSSSETRTFEGLMSR